LGELNIVFVDLEASAALLETAERDVPRLSASDIARVRSLAHDPDGQRRWRFSRIALRIVLERAAGPAHRNADFAVDKNGRPSLAGSAPYFNISHSGSAALIAVSKSAPVGVDLEHERELSMTEDRRRRVAAAASGLMSEPATMVHLGTDVDVLRDWVRLEAVAKARGTGIGPLLTENGVIGGKRSGRRPGPASQFEVRNLDVGSGYLAAVAAPTLPQTIDVLMFPESAEALAAFLSPVEA
jgi:4'-phosphopantetheinyl transferase